MNLGTLFKKNNDILYLDMEQIQKVTDGDFVRILNERVPLAPVEEMKFYAGKDDLELIYYRIGNTWYSFGWDKNVKSLIASIMDVQKGWQFIVGYMPTPTQN